MTLTRIVVAEVSLRQKSTSSVTPVTGSRRGQMGWVQKPQQSSALEGGGSGRAWLGVNKKEFLGVIVAPFFQILLTHNIIIVSGGQHNDLIFVYVANHSKCR